jgi:hypothetical protein
MFHAGTYCRLRRRFRASMLVSSVAMAFMLPAAPAHASCTADAHGIANSGGTAGLAAPAACPPAYGQPAGDGTGRKSG